APELLAVMDKFPDLAARVKGYVSIGGRRWDMKLENGITVKLPEVGADQAINRLVALDQEDGLLARDILAVDMRFSDRLVVRLSPEAETARQAMLTAKAKAPKRKAETKI